MIYVTDFDRVLSQTRRRSEFQTLASVLFDAASDDLHDPTERRVTQAMILQCSEKREKNLRQRLADSGINPESLGWTKSLTSDLVLGALERRNRQVQRSSA
jgi:hypothetical protein